MASWRRSTRFSAGTDSVDRASSTNQRMPLTSARRVDLIVTELAVIEPGPESLVTRDTMAE
jgi:acyl CoA:acetate/3-ketoacid CoA transferase beta subunit